MGQGKCPCVVCFQYTLDLSQKTNKKLDVIVIKVVFILVEIQENERSTKRKKETAIFLSMTQFDTFGFSILNAFIFKK